MKQDRELLQLCQQLAHAAGLNGNPPVGAVVAIEGEVIGRGEEASRTKGDITCHAEIEAIRQAIAALKTTDLSNCTLYSTHEPCVMCSYVIRYHRIHRVVFQKGSQYLGGATSPMPLLTSRDVPPHWSEPPLVVNQQ